MTRIEKALSLARRHRQWTGREIVRMGRKLEKDDKAFSDQTVHRIWGKWLMAFSIEKGILRIMGKR